MEKIKPMLRWVAVGIAACAVLFAFIAPHRPDPSGAPEDSPLPQAVLAAPASVAPLASPTPGFLAVYVCGAIRNTGVYRLALGSRIVDVVNKAGGLARDADGEAINLAEPLIDGMKVDIPRKGARAENSYASVDPRAVDPGAADLYARPNPSSRSSHRHRSSGRSSSHKLQQGQTLDINTATEAELMQLPGVGPGLARRIVEYRAANGPFATADDLQNVSGVGPSKFAKMEAFVRV